MNTIILGPMFSGKSTLLLKKIKETKSDKILFIKPKKDNRGYFTHNKEDTTSLFIDNNIKTLSIDKVNAKALLYISDFEYIFIDELFMIKDCYLIGQLLYNNNSNVGHCLIKEVYFAGLLATSENKIFKETAKLLPYCENIIKLNGTCSRCGKIANYSMYKESKTKEIVVGDENKYKCVCKDCYVIEKGIL